MSYNGWKHLKNYRLNEDFCARNIEMRSSMRSASRKKTGSSHTSTEFTAFIEKYGIIITIWRLTADLSF